MADVAGLIGLLDRMVDNGLTVIVIEHNLEFVARADWVLDMGSGAGNEGGKIVFEGVPAKLVKHPASLSAWVRTIWIVLTGETAPRLVTLIPAEKP